MPEPDERTEVPHDPVRCPHCQTTRLKVLKKIDRIETLYGNALMNRMRARRGDTLYHCVFCRLQFYDPRKPGSTPAPRNSANEDTAAEKSEPEAVLTAASSALAPFAPAAAAPAPSAPAPAGPAPAAAPSALALAVAPAPTMPVPSAPVNGGPPDNRTSGTNLTARVRIRGSIHSAEDLFIDGRMDGTLVLKEHRLTIGGNGMVKAEVRAAEVEILGTFNGNSRATGSVILRAGAKVAGDIRAGDIVIHDGAQFKGSVELVREQPRLPLG
jgi:cytoskeletal protein CcmA (bactofilin family)